MGIERIAMPAKGSQGYIRGKGLKVGGELREEGELRTDNAQHLRMKRTRKEREVEDKET